MDSQYCDCLPSEVGMADMDLPYFKTEETFSDMASFPVSQTTCQADSVPRPIPLLCTVCPEAPRFSDVSHLLTHIASKGHLHHETQTKLRAHQDLSSAVALQQYEYWYRENGIEVLLVERLKAKQAKEAARNKRVRASSVQSIKKIPKKKVKRTASQNTIKDDHEDLDQAFPIFPGFFAPETDVETMTTLSAHSDVLSLKGQVWPGMGKMDLANEEMKRTRNQRKPKSVMERMRRTSEGIEPTQVVMTPDFDVERVKGVYDDDTPVSDMDEPTPPPRKTTRTRRKKGPALVELSANVPRLEALQNGKVEASRFSLDRGLPSESSSCITSVGSTHDVFRDDDTKLGLLNSISYSTPGEQENRFDLRGRFGMLNPISRASLASPTPSSRDLTLHTMTGRDMHRGRHQAPTYTSNGNHLVLGGFGQQQSPLLVHDSPMFSNGSRIPFAATAHLDGFEAEQMKFPSHQHQAKHGDFLNAMNTNSLAGMGSHSYLDNTGVNPLFSHDRALLDQLNHCSAPQQMASTAGFTAVNQKERSHLILSEQDHRMPSNGIKLEYHMSEAVEDDNIFHTKEPTFDIGSLWSHHVHDHDLSLIDGAHSGNLDL